MALLKWALIALVIPLLACAFGYTKLEHGAAKVAKLLFFVFLLIFILILIAAVLGGEAIL